MSTRLAIFAEIDAERQYQEQKWGNAFDMTHTPADWWTFVTLYYSRYLVGWKNPTTTVPANFRIGLVKMATIIVAWIEALDRSTA